MQHGRRGRDFPANHDEKDTRSRPSTSSKTRSNPSSAQSFVGFHYERPVAAPPSAPHPSSATRKNRRSNSESTMSKAEYVNASFRFIVSPLSDPGESAWYTPDALIPWETIETVVVPLNQENSLLCPICLDTVQCPRITKCGHSFCVSCLLRHMNSDRSNARKCPMCMEYVFKDDLRTVLFLADAVAGDTDHSLTTPVHPIHIFQVPALSSSYQTPEASSRPSDSLFGNKLQLQHKFSFQHLVVSKGNCIPYLPETLLRKVMHSGLQDIPTSSMATPVVSQQRRAPVGSSSSGGSGVQSLLSQHLEQLAQTLPCYSTSPMSKPTVAETRYSRIMYRPLGETLAAYDLERVLLIDARASGSQEGDIDVLPHLDEALDLLSRRQEALLAQLQRDFIVDIDIHGSEKILPPGFSSSQVHSRGHGEGNVLPYSMLDNDSLYTHLYQATSGDLIFLHPLCQRVLQQHHNVASSAPVGYLPEVLSAKVVDIEHLRLSSTYKQKPLYLRHLPAYTAVALVEVDMKPLVSKEVYAQFAEEFVRRQNKRRDKKKLEARFHRQAQQRSQQYEDYYTQMAYAGYATDAFTGYEEFDSSYLDTLPTLQDVYIGNQLSDSSPASAGADATMSQEAGLATGSSTTPHGNGKAGALPPGAGFAEITQKFGNFPSLSQPQTTSLPTPPGASPTPHVGKWGSAGGKANVSQNTTKLLVTGNHKVSLEPSRTATSSLQLSAASLVRSNKAASNVVTSNSRVTIRSAELSAATSSGDGTGSGNLLTFRLEDALRNSRGKVKGNKAKSKGIAAEATPVSSSVEEGTGV